MKTSWIICNLCEGFPSLKNVQYDTFGKFYNHCIGFHNIPSPHSDLKIYTIEKYNDDEPDI